MLSFKVEGGEVVDVSPAPQRGTEWVDRNDMKTFEAAEKIAREASAVTGRKFVATETPNCYPRFDVVEAPAIGDAVSYSFNGDYYPDGRVVAISESLRLVRTDTGSRYYRRGKTGAWVKAGGTWTLVHGHISEKNPCF
jgi:hypothetical protein